MTKVQRTIIANGVCHEVACAVRIDGKTSPAAELLQMLEDRVWPDPVSTELPDEYQATIRKRFLASVELLAEEGDLDDRHYNRLRDGIWEFKVSTLRVSFYDTPGDGTYSPKMGEYKDSWDARASYWLPDDFDRHIRLGHHFGKSTKKTSEDDVRASLVIREEDLTHD